MEYLVEPQGIDTRFTCTCLGVYIEGGVDVCNTNCDSFCGAQVCSPRMEPMSLN